MLKHRLNLLSGHAWKPLEKLVNRRTITQILEKCRDRDACATKNPRAAHLSRLLLDFRTGIPAGLNV